MRVFAKQALRGQHIYDSFKSWSGLGHGSCVAILAVGVMLFGVSVGEILARLFPAPMSPVHGKQE